ncbi:MAG: hypothetical protein ACM3PZ_01950 [Bacillota bacterium]
MQNDARLAVNEEEAVNKMAELLEMSPFDKKEVIRKALQRQSLNPKFMHDLGYTRLMFARMLSKLESGLRSYTCRQYLLIE